MKIQIKYQIYDIDGNTVYLGKATADFMVKSYCPDCWVLEIEEVD